MCLRLARSPKKYKTLQTYRKLFVCHSSQNVSLFVESEDAFLSPLCLWCKKGSKCLWCKKGSKCEVQANFEVLMLDRVCVYVCWGMGGGTENVCVCSPWEGVGEAVCWCLPGQGGGGHTLCLALDKRLQCAPSLHIHMHYQYGGHV